MYWREGGENSRATSGTDRLDFVSTVYFAVKLAIFRRVLECRPVG